MTYPYIFSDKDNNQQGVKMKISKAEKQILVNAIQNNRGMVYPLPQEIEEKALLSKFSLNDILRSLYKKKLIELMRNHSFFKVTSDVELLKEVLIEE